MRCVITMDEEYLLEELKIIYINNYSDNCKWCKNHNSCRGYSWDDTASCSDFVKIFDFDD